VTTTKQHNEMMRWYRHETKKNGVDMHDVARFAISKGWKLAPPLDPVDLLAHDFARAARQETRYDKSTGKPYRAKFAYPVSQGANKPQQTLWGDIDEDAPRAFFLKSVVKRREGMVDDGVQLSLDLDHWNSIHPNEKPIELPWDLTDDISWRKNADNESVKKAS